MQEVDIYANDSETFSTDSFQDDGESFTEAMPGEPASPSAPSAPSAPAAPTAPTAQEGGKHHKPTEPIVVIKKQEVQPEEKYEESVSSEDSDSQISDTETDSTVDCLSRDPLFLVLSQYLANSKGNMVDMLCKINKNLKRIADSLEKHR